MLHLDGFEKVIIKKLLEVSGGEQIHFEFMMKICNCSGLFDDPESLVPKLGTCISYRS